MFQLHSPHSRTCATHIPHHHPTFTLYITHTCRPTSCVPLDLFGTRTSRLLGTLVQPCAPVGFLESRYYACEFHAALMRRPRTAAGPLSSATQPDKRLAQHRSWMIIRPSGMTSINGRFGHSSASFARDHPSCMHAFMPLSSRSAVHPAGRSGSGAH
ncbi:hypothetical protein OH76DRAFT_428273 [Lentinus brumalis]|uniref:Uncharacterized protein n=1 Tax=Lentinus brumalis TaxID=2498619 RepID=A0A371DWJ6_9APHY|nr:hypothetical protein OH76DRAFT_428273 [Polyporus brumalis]